MAATLSPLPVDADAVRQVFKAYDLRGRQPEQLDETLARAVGRCFVHVLGAAAVVVGHDMRVGSPALVGAFAEGATEAGADVVAIGHASTDELYFASGRLDLPGVMVTASHNPAGDNGVKLCRAGAAPVGESAGLSRIRDLVLDGARVPKPEVPGDVSSTDVLEAYAAHLVALAPVPGRRRLRVVVDAGNGMAGHTAPAVFARLAAAGARIELSELYFDLDGTFPNHPANPLDEATLRDLTARVVAERADVGLAFDGDADRCFAVDERGRTVDPSALTALIATRELAREPGAVIIHNLITSRAVPEIITEHGGTPVRTRVGHSLIKARMAETGAIFGGEHSGHFYFRDFWRADSGMLAALHLLAALAGTDVTASELLAEYDRYSRSGEINSVVEDRAAVAARVEAAYRHRDGVTLDQLDGLSVRHRDWSFNLRPSNTEPLLRLNVEGVDGATMQRVREDVLELVRSPVATG